MTEYKIVYPYIGTVTAEQLQSWAYDRMVDAGLFDTDTSYLSIGVDEAINYLWDGGFVTVVGKVMEECSIHFLQAQSERIDIKMMDLEEDGLESSPAWDVLWIAREDFEDKINQMTFGWGR